MSLEADRAVAVGLHLRMADILCRAPDGEVVQKYDPVLDHGHGRGPPVSAVLIEYRGSVDDVIDIPLARLSHGVRQRNNLLVNTSRLAIGVGLIVIVVQDLDLVLVLKENSAVAPGLARTGYILWHAPFKMELETAEALFSDYVTGGFVDSKHAIVDNPFGLSAFGRLPSVKVLSVEEYDGVRRG